MKPLGHTFGSDFCSISEVTRILLLNFVIFSVPCCLDCSPFENFLIYKIVFSQFLVLYFVGVVVGWGVVFYLEIFQFAKFSQPAKIRRSIVHLPSAANPPFPMSTINFPFFFIQPFNSHLRPLIGHDLSFAPPPPPPLYKALFLSFLFLLHPISSF